MKKSPTKLEAMVIIILLIGIGVIFWSQQMSVRTRQQDSQRKVAINTIYAYLENVYYPQRKGYPASLSEGAFKGLPLASLQDPEGHTIGDQNSDLNYIPTGCDAGVCSSYTLSAQLKDEANFTKSSLRN